MGPFPQGFAEILHPYAIAWSRHRTCGNPHSLSLRHDLRRGSMLTLNILATGTSLWDVFKKPLKCFNSRIFTFYLTLKVGNSKSKKRLFSPEISEKKGAVGRFHRRRIRRFQDLKLKLHSAKIPNQPPGRWSLAHNLRKIRVKESKTDLHPTGLDNTICVLQFEKKTLDMSRIYQILEVPSRHARSENFTFPAAMAVKERE